MGKVVSGSFPPMIEPRAVEHVIPTIKLRMAKEHILNAVNRINKEHGHFKASASGNPTLVYGEGHDMKHHGEGKPYVHGFHNTEEYKKLPNIEPRNAEDVYLSKSSEDRRNNPKEYGDETGDND